MSTTIKNVIIIGAGGNLGPSILEALNKESQFTVSILSRKSSKSTFPSHNKVFSVSDNYPEEELLEAFKGQDAVVSTINAYNQQTQKDIIDAAVKAGVKRFVPSEFGSNTPNPKTWGVLPMIADKHKINQYLQEQESKGLSWSGVVTGPFFDWGLQIGFLGFSLPTHTATIYDSGTTRWDTTTLPTIGLAVVKVLLHPAETANKQIYVSSFTTSQNEVLAALEKVSGRKWDVQRETTEEITKRGQEKLEKGDGSGAVDLIVAMIYGEGRGGAYSEEEGLANGMLGLPEETVEGVVKRVNVHPILTHLPTSTASSPFPPSPTPEITISDAVQWHVLLHEGDFCACGDRSLILDMGKSPFCAPTGLGTESEYVGVQLFARQGGN